MRLMIPLKQEILNREAVGVLLFGFASSDVCEMFFFFSSGIKEDFYPPSFHFFILFFFLCCLSLTLLIESV